MFSLDREKPTWRFFNFVFRCYAVYLANGYTLNVQSIKADTIVKYLLAAASLVQMFDGGRRDLRKVKDTNTTCHQIQKIIAEVK